MSLDLSALSSEAREAYIVVGRQFGSSDTVAQANQTLKGIAEHGAELTIHGFATEDGARLAEARDALVAAGADRVGAVGEKKITNANLAEAIRDGKKQRESARSILENTLRALTEVGGAEGKAGATVIRTALQQTRSVGADAGKLADQLEVLLGAISDPSVLPVASGRGGPAATMTLLGAASALRAAAAECAGAPGTPAETERVDLLDGIVVALARGARKAARAAAKRLGAPALAADFELTQLYGPRVAAKAKAEPGAPGEPPAGGGVP